MQILLLSGGTWLNRYRSRWASASPPGWGFLHGDCCLWRHLRPGAVGRRVPALLARTLERPGRAFDAGREAVAGGRGLACAVGDLHVGRETGVVGPQVAGGHPRVGAVRLVERLGRRDGRADVGLSSAILGLAAEAEVDGHNHRDEHAEDHEHDEQLDQREAAVIAEGRSVHAAARSPSPWATRHAPNGRLTW